MFTIEERTSPEQKTTIHIGFVRTPRESGPPAFLPALVVCGKAYKELSIGGANKPWLVVAGVRASECCRLLTARVVYLHSDLEICQQHFS